MFILLLESAMIGVFVSLDLFLFYVFWDAMLMPMYFLIGIWGYDRRIYAADQVPALHDGRQRPDAAGDSRPRVLHSAATGGYTLRSAASSTSCRSRRRMQVWFFLAFALAFAIKVPLFPFHTWLPDAHVEAPTAGSVILAGVLLKMGTYGLVRFAFPLFPAAAVFFAPYLRDARRRRHHLRRARRDGAAGHEEARRVLEREPPRLRRARHLRR